MKARTPHNIKAMRATKAWLILVFALLCQFAVNRGVAAETSKIEVFSLPWDLHRMSGTNGQLCPVYANRFSDCLPGALYDVREALKSNGIKFEDTDFALFSPGNRVLVVKTSPDNVEMLEVIVTAVNYDPPANLTIAGQIQVKENSKVEKEVKWRIPTHSGQRCAISAKGKNEIGYNFEIEPIINADGEHVDCKFVLKTNYRGQEHTVETFVNIYAGSQHSMLIGTTPGKGQVFFQITPTLEWVTPPTPYDDLEKKKRLIECIKKHLENDSPASFSGSKSIK